MYILSLMFMKRKYFQKNASCYEKGIYFEPACVFYLYCTLDAFLRVNIQMSIFVASKASF